jgi:serine/threonine protein kinase
MAPEMYENVKITYSIDIFPLGCVFAFTLNDGHHPFDIEPPNENESKNDTRVRIKERSIRIERKQPMILTEGQLRESDRIAYKLIESMLNPDPKSRPSTSKVLQHEYFKLSGVNSIRSVHQPLYIRTTVRDAQVNNILLR